MPSFDIVSEVDTVELRNAVQNAQRELSTRFDFRGVEASISLEKEVVKLVAESDFQLGQLVDILRGNLAKRNVDARSMDPKDIVHSGKTFHQDVVFKQGIEALICKKIVKIIKENKSLKVQSAIQGEKVRVTGKKRDDLQAVMAVIRESDLGQPFQFENFRD
uniref:YajQ family cyclic di-GMP-binding protein n=1 Tax=Thaumasiovibrio occultus TaxID=1891184 RepID=UPI000B35E133|nr:YajQ family cyclic di-GMP-binding protein [Thaumasiovibrio occultus]